MASSAYQHDDDTAVEASEVSEEDGEFEGKLLHQSCLWDNSDLLSDLLFGDELKNINSQDSKGRTALHAAVISNSLKCARLLLMNEADPNIRQFAEHSPNTTTTSNNVSGQSCLHIAASRGFEEMVQILIEFNANIYAKDANGFTAMDLAEQAHHQNIVDLLKSSIVVREKMRSDLYESLALAVHKGDVEQVKSLLVQAKRFTSAEQLENEAEHSATTTTNTTSTTTSLVNFAPNGSNTLLFKACQEGHLEIVGLLIAAGSDGRQHPVTKYSPLYISAYHGRLHICELLLRHFPELAAVYTVEHWLPVHAAAMNNHQDIVKLLLTYNYPRQVLRRFVCRCELADTSSSSSTAQSTGTISRSQHSFSRGVHHSKGDLKEPTRQYYIYLMPFDLNAQDIAGQSLLYLATLLGNQSLVEFLLAFHSKAILYVDYLGYCDKDPKEAASIQADTFEIVDDNQHQHHFLDYIFSESLTSPDEEDIDDGDSGDNASSSSSGSSSLEDITVISSFDTKHSSSQNAIINKAATTSTTSTANTSTNTTTHNESTNRSGVSPIQRLIEKLSPSSSPSKTSQHSTEKNATTTNKPPLPPPSSTLKAAAATSTSTKKLKRRRFYFSSKPKPPTYCISPFLVDLYCNYSMETALHCAVKKRHYSIASLLLAQGANPNLPINGQLVNPSSIVTRVSHFNHHNFFLPPLSISDSLHDLRNLATAATASASAALTTTTTATNADTSFESSKKSLELLNQSNQSTVSTSSDSSVKSESAGKQDAPPRIRSSALREAIRNRDKAMVDLLFRFGARDQLAGEEEEENEEDEDIREDLRPSALNALSIAFHNNDQHFVSKLLSLKAFTDCECKINKRAFDIVGSNCMNALNKFNMINNVTVSSMFPSKAVMIDWHQLGLKSLESGLQRYLLQWLVDSSLVYNVKLRLSQVQEVSSGTSWNTALAAITRIDLSNNSLTSVPLCLFTDLPSMKILNLSKNRLQTLPEMELMPKTADSFDDENVFRRNSGQLDADAILSSSPKSSKGFFSRMRKSQSVTVALSSSGHSRPSKEGSFKRSDSNKSRLQSIEEYSWNLPFLEELHLQDNQLECLPSSLFQQPELKLLDLSNNKLRTLPPLFWFTPKLSELNLSLNLLCDLPSPSQCSPSCTADLSSSFESLSIASMNDASPGMINSSTREMSGSSKSIPKSISTSSISENLKSVSRNSFDRSFNDLSPLVPQQNDGGGTHINLTPFELNAAKPWLAKVNILNETLHGNINDGGGQSKGVDGNGTGNAHTTTESVSSASAVSRSPMCCNLTQLNLSHNGFERVPFLLSCLATRLTHLNLSYNRLTSVFDAEFILGHYPVSLKHLDLSHNLIEEWVLPEENLDFDEVVSHRNQCCWHFSGNQIGKYVESAKGCPFKQHTKLDNLKTLVLTKNYLKMIVITRDELAAVSDPLPTSHKIAANTSLSSSYNESSKFASRFYTSKKLSSNNFGSMDDLLSTLSQTTGDINLNSKASRYTRLFFPNLSMLDVANNQVAEVPKTISYLSQLSVLNLSGNLELTRLPPEMGLLTKLWNLNTRGCLNLSEPLRSMIISKTYKTADIISYLNSILENSKPYNRMKLMIVGVQGIGKTSILEQLRHEGTGRRTRAPPDHWGKRMGNKSMGMKTPRGVTLSTVGVDLFEWTYERKPLRGLKDRERSLSRTRVSAFQAAPNSTMNFEGENIGPITFRTWDFGGQREYYATHQYFLSKRSIYLVVWKITDGERGVDGLHSWLLNIQSRAPNSPVIIIGTHFDLVKEYFPPFFSSDLQKMIRDRYMADSVDADKRGLPRVVASIEVSTKTRHNIRLLANIIYETATEMRTSGNKDRLLEQKVPATYLALEEVVSLLASERKSAGAEPVLHTEQYRAEVVRAMKERHSLAFRDFAELQQATRFLHENGVMLHYEDANLKDLYFLDPQWLCDVLAHVVTIREINPFARNGVMKTEHLLQLFKNSSSAPADVQNYLISLLNKFELALTWDNRTLLIPSLLPTEEQLKSGHPGSDIMIPLRSRLKMRRSSTNNAELFRFELKNQLHFQELGLKRKSPCKEATPAFNADDDHHLEADSQPICIATALARHSESIHRMLLLSYVPCGFWSRLITRMLADESVVDIVRSFYHIPPSAQADPVLGRLLGGAQAKWHCWQTGFGLCYLDTFLLRVKEYGLSGNASSPTASGGTAGATAPAISTSFTSKSFYPYDYQRIKFYLGQQTEQSGKGGHHSAQAHAASGHDTSSLKSNSWSEVYIAPQGSALIEIYLPNQSLQVETFVDVAEGEEEKNNNDNHIKSESRHRNQYILEPNMEMLTKLLVILVEHIDTLLEDWYPSLGTRFIHTSDGRFLITRIVPCTLCMQCFVEETSDTTQSRCASQNKVSGANQLEICKSEAVLSPDTAEVDSNLVDFYKSEVKKATLQSQVKQEFHDSAISTLNTEISVAEDATPTSAAVSMYHPVYAFMVEECILAVYEDRRLECPAHARLRMDKLAPDVMFADLKENFCIEREQLRFGKLLGRGSFGFVFRAFYSPKRKSTSHFRYDALSPPHFTKRSVANSKFYLPNSATEDMTTTTTATAAAFESFEVALKLLQPIRLEQWSSGIRKHDLEAYSAMKSKWERDPLQYACKAYCTARTELNILASLKHSNIASCIGICPKPLALVLTLAPQGSLDTHTKAYRRSGVRIAAHVLQQAFLQISKALEYLHQHHIIYRDLKSENVLVWSFPSALSTLDAEVHLKLADYGISRSSLPTGTKGFGGTEGFMAPEIMLHNGEEEYTEKVDCFSFAMFMYELCTLRFPFEGQEFAIRESILDGIRPALSQRDLHCLPESFVDLMVRCWEQEPSERPTISQVVSIISSPEFCSLLDVINFPEQYAIICATGYEKMEAGLGGGADSGELVVNSNNSSSSSAKQGINFSVCLSKVGQQIDLVESSGNHKWSTTGHRLTCDNLANRTIISACVVNGQLWLGDSQARLHLYSLNNGGDERSSTSAADHQFKAICMIQLDFENPASLTAIKTICWLAKARLVVIGSTSGRLWLLSLDKLQAALEASITRTYFRSSDLEVKEVDNNRSMILCITHMDKFTTVSDTEKGRCSRTSEHCVEIWCGQPDGKIAIVQVRPEDMFVRNQIVVDHYDDGFVRSSLHAIYIGSSVPLADRNDVFMLIASSTEPFIWSVLFTGFIIYQWDAYKRQIVHRLDCSKLAPCSESLMSISIEDHLKPGSCQVTAIACNEDNEELYVGTNSGCIIVAESHSLKPVTVFRPYSHEVKFIITFPDNFAPFPETPVTSEPIRLEEVKLSFEEEKPSVGRNALRSLHQVWPFGKRSSSLKGKTSKADKGAGEMLSSSPVHGLPESKKRRPFVTIGRGYRNLLDRFIYTSSDARAEFRLGRQMSKFKDNNSLYGIIWDAGSWNVE